MPLTIAAGYCVVTAMYDVAVVRYEKPLESLREAVELAGGLGDVHSGSKVFIKPNLCLWREGVSFPKYGVLTTARLIQDIVVILKEHGVDDITIVEGVVEIEKRSESTLGLIARGMGLSVLEKRYGVKIVDVMKGSFTKIPVDDKKISVSKR